MTPFRSLVCRGFLLSIAGNSLALPHALGEPNTQWIQQFGTQADDYALGGVAPDGQGDVYLGGATRGALGGPNAGDLDGFVSRYDGNGALVWSRQFGSAAYDDVWGVSADGQGNVYVTGDTSGDLSGPNAGSDDTYLRKYGPTGELLWARQHGTPEIDRSRAVSTDGFGNVFVAGATLGDWGGAQVGDGDATLSRYTADGELVWTRQWGTTRREFGLTVSVDGLGNVLVAGKTQGNLAAVNLGGFDGYDAFVSKFSAAGDLLWSRQFVSTVEDAVRSVSVATDLVGNVILGAEGVFAKLDEQGAVQWQHEVAGYPIRVAADLRGNAYLSDGASLAMSKFDSDGGFLWTHDVGSAVGGRLWGMAADSTGNVFLSGNGDLGWPGGELELWIAKVSDPVPEPSSLALMLLAAAGWWPFRVWSAAHRTTR